MQTLVHNQVLPPDEIIFGRTLAMQRIRKQLEKVCSAKIPVLIQGEGGSGKEVLARWIHCQSPGSSGPFIKVNFAAIPGSLLESELFGYQAGAFTGAKSARVGRIEMAQGGTLFLDQITDLGPSFQAKLLQLLQDGRFTRLGDHGERKLEARIICASNGRIEEAVRCGRFREDLYYRINVFRVELVQLSERREDIPGIAGYLFAQLCRRFQRQLPPLPPALVHTFQNREWKGNIRELENRIASYVLLGTDGETQEHPALRQISARSARIQADGTIPLKRIAERACREVGREVILRALQANHWNRRRTAEQLRISYRALLYKIREAGLQPKRSRSEANEVDLRASPVGKPSN